MKKFLPLLCTAALLFSITGCGSGTAGAPATSSPASADAESTVQSIYGRVTAVDGVTITVLPGTYSRKHILADDQTSPKKQERAEGRQSSELPKRQSDTPNAGQTPPEISDGQQPGGSGAFLAGTETKTFDLSSADIFLENRQEMTAGTMEDITADAIVELVVENNTVTGVIVKSAMGGGMDQ